MRKYILTIIILLTAVHGFGQETPNFELQNYAPKSPEAAAFLKYGEYPVDLSTGTPNISIPLYTIESGEFKLPISLDYHASGIKVNQEATWVGLGWNLQFGAQVVLSVRDDVDENNVHVDNIPDDDAIYAYWDVHPYCFNSGPISDEHLEKSRVKDVYVFSSPTANGNFYIRNFANNDVVVFPPDASFKVELFGENRASMTFKITDSFGNIYFFTDTKEISARTMTHNDTYISAWYVDKIKTATNREIDFVYQNDGSLSDYTSTDTIEIKSIGTDCGSTSPSLSNQVGSVVVRGGSTTTSIKRIKEILFNNGDSKVEFEKTAGREDLVGANSYLNIMYVKHKVNGVFTIKKGYDFGYTYFVSNDNAASGYHNLKRLRLDNVLDLVDGSGHQFVYSTLNIPSKISRAQDYYGYYNGIANLDLIPKHFLSSPYLTEAGSGNRGVNPNVNQMGILKEIHYPTKGWTKFNYETNQYYGIDEFDQHVLHTVNSNVLEGTGPGSANPADFESPGIDDIPICNLANQNNCVQYREVPFTAANAQGIFTFQVIRTGIPLSEMHYKYARIRVITSSGEIYNSAKIQDNGTFTISIQGWNSGKVIMEAYSQYVSIVGLQLRYVNNNPVAKNINGAGLRVQNIENYNQNNVRVLKKEFEYKDVLDNSKSSGKLVNNTAVMFESVPLASVTIIGSSANYVSSYTLSSSSRFGIESNSVVYKYVKEKVVDQNFKNGHTLYEFTTDSDEMPLGNPTLQIVTSWKRGRLKEKKEYKTFYPGGGVENDYLIRKEVNTYFEDNSKIVYINGFKLFRNSSINYTSNATSISGLSGSYVALMGICHVPSNITEQYEIVTYNIGIPWFYLKSTVVEENFYNSGNALNGTVTNTKTFKYNNSTHLQLSTEEQTNSTGETIETNYFYPQDTAMSTEPIVNDLITKNIIAAPLLIQNKKAGSTLTEVKTAYKNWGNNLLMPEFIKSSKGGTSFENRIRFTIIDNTNGNPLELQQENGTTVSYIWGYSKTQPIAKIENATNAQIATALGLSLATVTEANMAAIDGLRTSLPNAMTTTFTYIPLIGVTTIKDPKGDVTTFEYDSFGRLVLVKDNNGNKLSENEYHFKN